jgi:NAD(P)-dependent dehydrogenase (short-subunit alcohol dehydrogenase family)
MTILVTGASAGIGFATAAGLAELGHTIFVTGRDEERGRSAVEDLRGRKRTVVHDVLTLGAVVLSFAGAVVALWLVREREIERKPIESDSEPEAIAEATPEAVDA